MTKHPLILALDTASDAIALAVGQMQVQGSDDVTVKILGAGDMLARREANVNLVPAIDRLFKTQGLDKTQVGAVVCGRGPGSFTGVRIAVATAKGLASGLGVPLVGVITSDAQAHQAWLEGIRGSVAVLTDAMRGEIYPVRYTLDEKGVRRDDSLTVVKAELLAQKWQGYEKDLVLCGDALYKYGDRFDRFAWLDEDFWRPKGLGLLKAFEQQFAADTPEALQGQSSKQLLCGDNTAAVDASIAALLPVYTRLSDAEENERKRLAAGGAIAQGALTEVPVSGVAREVMQKGQSSFRPAAVADIADMTTLEQQTLAHIPEATSENRWTESLLRSDIAKPDFSWWVCYVNNELAGFIGGQLIDGQMHVLDVVVKEPHRRRGIARQLLGHLIGDAKDLGATELTLEVRTSNAAAQALYKSLGLEVVGTRKQYYAPRMPGEQREDALIMTGGIEGLSNPNPNSNPSLAPAAIPAPSPTTTPALAPSPNQSQNQNQNRNSNPPLILALESSCDETAAALINGKGELLSNVVASQTDFHARFGGVVPEIASRKHTEAIYPVAVEALGKRSWKDLDALAVTYAPGLIGALVVGVAFAKGVCWAANLPLIKVNHLEGHIYANRFEKCALGAASQEDCFKLDASALEPPFVIALLSGGNTLLVHVKAWGEYQVLGETLDDAIGEAYDKVAKALGLGYPGGPVIARLAAEGNPHAIAFPRALLHSHDYTFSYSGLKTAVLTVIREQATAGTLNVSDIAASFEQAVIDVQVAKAREACLSLGVTTFCIGGGVAANVALRKAYTSVLEPLGIQLVFPPQIACTDNAAMIAAVALDRFTQGKFADLSDDAAAQVPLESPY